MHRRSFRRCPRAAPDSVRPSHSEAAKPQQHADCGQHIVVPRQGLAKEAKQDQPIQGLFMRPTPSLQTGAPNPHSPAPCGGSLHLPTFHRQTLNQPRDIIRIRCQHEINPAFCERHPTTSQSRSADMEPGETFNPASSSSSSSPSSNGGTRCRLAAARSAHSQ